MSRKLLFASGLLVCLGCELQPEAAEARRSLRNDGSNHALLEYLERQFRRTPLEVLASAALNPLVSVATAKLIFQPYCRFLSILDDEEKRRHLKELRPESFDEDPLFRDVRRISHDFQDGLTALFFESDPQMGTLTKRYGVF